MWLERDATGAAPPVTLFRLDLDRPGSEPVQTPISYGSSPPGFALSADGRRVAAYEWEGRLTVASVDDGRLLAAIRYDSRAPPPGWPSPGPATC